MRKALVVVVIGLVLGVLVFGFAACGGGGGGSDAQPQWFSVSGGQNHTLAIRTDGSLWAWGSDGSLKLGDGGTMASTSSPVRIGTGENWTSVSAGVSHSLGIREDGTLWAWGSNNHGELGTFISGFPIGAPFMPMYYGSNSNAYIATNWFMAATSLPYISAAIKTNGDFMYWGNTAADPYDEVINLGVFIGFETVYLAGGDTHWAYIDSTGRAWEAPADVSEIGSQAGTATNWSSVSAGMDFTLGMQDDGTLWGWGDNTYGQLGTSSSAVADTNTPLLIGAASTWNSYYAGATHSLGVRSDGTLWAWGSNYSGQLGTNSAMADTSIPIQVGTAADWDAVFGGYSYSMAIKDDGTLWTWGQNGDGQLGIGSSGASVHTPTQVTLP